MEGLIPLHSELLTDTVSTPEMREIWTENNMLHKWMKVERAITEIQAQLGIIPREAAEKIAASLTPKLLTASHVRTEAQRAGHLMVGFLRAFREVCGDAAEHFHVGPTTQDILDTGLALQISDAYLVLLSRLLDLEERLCRLALKHKSTVVMGRTHEQHALPYTFGFVLARWASEVRDHVERFHESEQRWRCGCLSGGVGAQNAFVELSDETTARRLEAEVCRLLGLITPPMDLHPRVDRFTELVTQLALLCSTLGRIGLHLRTMERPEVGEASQTYDKEACSSSTMPHKRNPEAAERVDGLASLVRGFAASMLSVRMADHRDSTRIPVHFTAIPGAFALTDCAVSTIDNCLATLQVNASRMRANLDHPATLGQTASERLMIAIYRKTGRRHWAHTVLAECARLSRESGRHMRAIIEEMPEVGTLFTSAELDALMDLSTYTGTAEWQTTENVERVLTRNREDRHNLGADS
ncbi:MAG: lyase family protein [Gammaproteobacteria bacterium]|nr:lyase family protein [Gammaproteobacteria bacterium]